MSYYVALVDDSREANPYSSWPHPVVDVTTHQEGGVIAIGGSSEAAMHVTYNYSSEFCRAWTLAGGSFDGEGDGTLGEMIGGKRAADVIEALTKAVEILGAERDPYYWAPTAGNAGYALSVLLGWALQHPNATFEVH